MMNNTKRLLAVLAWIALCLAHPLLFAQSTSGGAERLDGHPAWIMQGNVYEVNVRQYTPEGTFAAFAKHLGRLKQMGVQTLWFMPINPISKTDRKGALGSYYAVSDYTAINPEFGNLADWKALVKECHAKGFKVIIDWVPNHTGADHYWMEKHPDFYVKDSITGKAVSQFDWTDTRKLNYQNPALADSMIADMKFWINETGIDGFRCDQAFLVPETFWKRSIAELKQSKNILMIAEAEDSWVHDAGFDVSYAWKAFHTMVDIAAGKKTAIALDTVIHEVDSGFAKNALLLYFTSNHDENSWNKADYGTMPGNSHAPFAVLTQTIGRSVPLIYSGQEEPYLDSISFFYKDTIQFNHFKRATFYQKLLGLRNTNPALAAEAAFTKLTTSADAVIYAYQRTAKGRKVLVLLNLSNQPKIFNITGAQVQGNPLNIFTGKHEPLKNNETFNLEGWGYKVYSY